MCTVVNRYKVNMGEPDIVYIGRGSMWGNPYIIGEDGTREEVVAKFGKLLWNLMKSCVRQYATLTMSTKVLSYTLIPVTSEVNMNDPKDIAVRDLYRTLDQIERTLRQAGSLELKEYHSPRDAMLQKEFIKMANDAKESLEFADSLVVFFED